MSAAWERGRGCGHGRQRQHQFVRKEKERKKKLPLNLPLCFRRSTELNEVIRSNTAMYSVTSAKPSSLNPRSIMDISNMCRHYSVQSACISHISYEIKKTHRHPQAHSRRHRECTVGSEQSWRPISTRAWSSASTPENEAFQMGLAALPLPLAPTGSPPVPTMQQGSLKIQGCHLIQTPTPAPNTSTKHQTPNTSTALPPVPRPKPIPTHICATQAQLELPSPIRRPCQMDTRQLELLTRLHTRNGEAPAPVIKPSNAMQSRGERHKQKLPYSSRVAE